MAKIRDILIITTPEDQPAFKRLLGDGSRFGVNLQYAVQEKPNGLAEAFIIGEDFIAQDAVCLVLGDNIFHGPGLEKRLLKAKSIAEDEANPRAVVFGYEVSDPQRYGVAEIAPVRSDGMLYTVTNLVEKPVVPMSNVAVTGLYFYPNYVIEVAKNITPSERGELEITEVNKRFNESTANDGGTMLDLIMLDRGFAWLDTGTFESLHEAAGYVETIEKRQGIQIACLEEIAWKNRWIGYKKLEEIVEKLGKNSYRDYIHNKLVK